MKTIDARGMLCPQPVIETKKALKDITDNELEVLVDNDIAVQNIMKLASYMKLEAVSSQMDEKCYRVEIKTGVLSYAVIESSESCCPDVKREGAVVVLSSDCMGEGDEVLGRILMKGFVYALTELEKLPETILLYNGGAKLSVEGSESAEDLKKLESEGVEILTCGTCLKHYGLSEKLAVGGVTNMYTIAEKLTGANVVVRP